jgi:hypothetical protein
MEIHNNTNPRLDELFREARNEKPVMSMDEAEKIISSGNYTPAATPRGALIGMNNLIVVSGIIVSSFLAFMVLKVDRQDDYARFVPRVDKTVQSADVAKAQPAAEQLNNTEVAGASQNNSSEPEQNLNVASLLSQPKDKPANHFIASSSNVISTPSAVAPAKSEEAIASMKPADADVLPGEMNAKAVAEAAPNSELKVDYNNEDGDKVHLVLRGNEVSELSIADKKISPSDYNKYRKDIEMGRNILTGKSAEVNVNDDDANSLKLVNFFDKELRNDNILTDEVNYIFELSSTRLLIGGKKQSKDVFKKYLHLYEAKTGNKIVETSVYKFEKGAK